MIAPTEWGKSGDHLTFIAEVIHKGDKTWKVTQVDEE